MPASVVSRRNLDDASSVHSYPSQPRHYTTVRRYKYQGTLPDEERENEAMRLVLHDRHGNHESEEEIDIKVTERERSDGRGRGETYRIVRRRSASQSSSSSSSSGEEEEERKTARSVRSPYALEKYSKSTEYFSQPAPQPIVIRERKVRPMIIERDAPQQIVVREQPPRQIIRRERREPNYELVEKQQERDDRSLFSEEDYYYYRGPVRGDEEPRRRRRHRHHRHEEEAALAAGAGALALASAGRHRRNRRSDRDAYSDDDVVVVRRERSLSSSPDSAKHRRHIGEGVVAGLAAAAVTRNRRKSRGENAGGRLGTYVGYGALGGVGAEVLSRLNRNRSRSRSRSTEFIGRGRDRRRESRSRSRSRSKSISTKEAVAGVIGLGALAAIAYTAGKRGNKTPVNETTVIEEGPARGRSRSGSRSLFRRRTSTTDYSDGALTDPDRDSALNPQHRNNTIAKAGLAGAVAAGAYEWNKRRNSRSRSKSRIREGVPIVATGLASAAVAGLYERNKAKREARSRSRVGRSVSAPASRRGIEDESLVSYGDDPIEPDDRHRESSRSHRRHRRDSASRSVSPDNHRHHHRGDRSRSRGVAEAAAVAAAAGVAAHEAGKRRERRRNRDQRRQEEASAANQYSPPYSPSEAPSNYYPSNNAFPPPPTAGQQPYDQEPYRQPNGTNPAYYNNSSHAEQNYGSQEPVAYNPAQYGVTRGPTLPHGEASAGHYEGHNSHGQAGYHDPRYPNEGPENMV